MANSLDINTDPTERNLDVVQQKLNKILATIQQINSSMGGIPSQFGSNSSANGSAGNSAQSSPIASTNVGGVLGGNSNNALLHQDNPSIISSIALSNYFSSGNGGGPNPYGGNALPSWSGAGGGSYGSYSGPTPPGGFPRVPISPTNPASNAGVGDSFTPSVFGTGGGGSLFGPPAPGIQTVFSNLHNSISHGAAAIGVATTGVAGLLNAYSRSEVSGEQNQLGYGAVYGGIIGAGVAVGASLAASVAAGATLGAAAGSFTGPGAIATTVIGGIVGAAGFVAAQSPYAARAASEGALAAYSVSTGSNVQGLADSAKAITNDYDSHNASTDKGFFSGYIGRALHLYQGTDQASEQQVAGAFSTIGSAFQNAGITPVNGEIQRLTRSIFDSGNAEEAGKIAESFARGQGNINKAGGNVTDLYKMVGADATETFLRKTNRGSEADQLASSITNIDKTAHDSTGAGYGAQIASNAYGASAFGGQSTLTRTGEFNTMISGVNAQVGALDNEMSALAKAPNGNDSNEYKAKSALKSELLKQIASESAQRAQSISTDIQGSSGVNLTQNAVQSTIASLYGNSENIRAAASTTFASLSDEADKLKSVTGLSYQDQIARDKRLADISLQQAALPAQAHGQMMRRNLLPLETNVGNAAVAYQGATMYGSDANVGKTALTSIEGQQAIINSATASLNDPYLSVEDRAAAQARINAAQSAQLTIRAGSRDVLLNRIEGRANLTNSNLGNALNVALGTGSGADVRNAAIATMNGLDIESASLSAQLNAGGLTTEQQLRLQGRRSQIAGERFNIFQSTIDSAYNKDDLSNYEINHTRTQGAQERLNYLPFSASNAMKLSIQSLNENKAQLAVLNQRESDLKATGNLSPEREYEIVSQREHLLTQNAQTVGQLSEGMENRLPALSANAPSFFGRYSSAQLAALNLQIAGSPIRGQGAVSGSQLKMQDDWLRSAGGDPADVNPHSRTSSLNSGASGDRLASVIDKLVNVLDKLSGNTANGIRPGMAQGQAAAQTQRQGLDVSNLYNTRN